MNENQVDYFFDTAFEAILCTGINKIGDIYKLREIARDYYKTAIKNDQIRNSIPLSE